MTYIHYSEKTGRIEVTTPDEKDIGLPWIKVDDDFVDSYVGFTHYIDAGVLTPLPTKPTSHHIFDYTTKQWIDPRTPETEWPLVRAERDRRLQASDWTQLPDVPLATKEIWATYRQALRDITKQPDPFNIVWPTPPQ